jgi:hypothetical protein
MPTALTQPRQFGWQVTQLNYIGNLRPSRATPARAAPLNIATNAMQRVVRRRRHGRLVEEAEGWRRGC